MSLSRVTTEQNVEGHLYNILNLGKGATQSEVHERYRSLSLVFHPDKQHDEKAKEVATNNFLKIQKAYQVLSDPFLREVYDQLGEDGLTIKWPDGLRMRSIEEVREELNNIQGQIRRKRQSESLPAKGTLSCVVNATPLFQSRSQYNTLSQRLGEVGIANYTLRHDVQKRLSDKTTLMFGAEVKNRLHRVDFSGTIQYTFSPRISSLATVHFAFPYLTTVETTYQDGVNSLIVKCICAPGVLLTTTPALNIGFGRKLFRQTNTQGSLDLRIGSQPHVKLRLTSPTPFGLKLHNSRNGDGEGSTGSLSGLETGVFFSTYGLNLETDDLKLVGEIGANLIELGATIKTGVTLGITGFHWIFSGNWSIPSQAAEVNTSTTLGATGIVFILELARSEQRLSLPIVLSTQYNPHLALGTTVLPAAAAVLLYRFFILPRRRARRLAHLRSARKSLEDSEERRERNVVEGLLKDLARKFTQHEKAKQGLVILEATYGSTEKEDVVPDVTLDVTVPIQALVRHSQLYIPSGEDAKSSLQGFYDPAPFLPKALRIRYLFREQMHYAEIPDSLPTVLPLAEHRVDGQ